MRSSLQPKGISPGLEAKARRFLERENAIAERALFLVHLVKRAGGKVLFEHPAKVADATSRYYHVSTKNISSIFDWEEVAELQTRWHCMWVELSLCALLHIFRKATRLLYSQELHAIVGPLGALDCEHGPGEHAGGHAYGKDRNGRSLSALSARYPFALGTVIVDCAALCAGRDMASLRSFRLPLERPQMRSRGEAGHTTHELTDDEADPMPALVSVSDSEVSGDDDDCSVPRTTAPQRTGAAAGARLHPQVQAAVDAARYAAPHFASSRNTVPAREGELLLRAVRDDTAASAEYRGRHQRLPPRSPGQPFGFPAPSTSGIPAGRIRLPDLFLPGVWQRILQWFKDADRSLEALKSGSFVSPGTLIVLQGELQPWARGILWDTSDPENCVLAVPSTREGHEASRGSRRQLDGAALRRMAMEIGWDDLDICDQADNGMEGRSSCSLTTILAFHHTGVAQSLEAARKVVDADIAEGWVRAAVRWLPRVPIRVLPRNVILTDKQKVDPQSQELVTFVKARISTDEGESRSEDSPNAGIPKIETTLDLCTVQDFAVGCAVVRCAFGGAGKSGAAVIDLESAFRFLLIQWLDLWLHGFVWWTPTGEAGICLDLRMGFGGAFGPNRFQRVMLILRAYITFHIAQFDLAHPLPAHAQRWRQERRAAQTDGHLPAGNAQTAASYVQVFLDDFALSGGTDVVVVPPYLHRIKLQASEGVERVTGGHYLARDTRVHVYTLIGLWAIELLRLAASPSKVVCATRVICLGLRVAIDLALIDCPSTKAEVMITTMLEVRAKVTDGLPISLKALERLVGRLGNISQIYSALRLWLAAGYALIRIRYRVRAASNSHRPRLVGFVTLRAGGRRERELLRLLDLAGNELLANAGVPLAARAVFPAFGEPGSALVVTDASGIDGVGGYAVAADVPGVVFLLSEWWPPNIKAALEMVARPKADRVTGAPRFAMPSAEAFGMFIVARALDAVTPLTSVTVVGDCMPAIRAFSAATSGSAQVRHILREAQLVTPQWLAAHVKRELNVDPDRLSHPLQCADVAAEVDATPDLRAVELTLDARGWEILEEACRLPLAVDELHPDFT